MARSGAVALPVALFAAANGGQTTISGM